MVSDKGIFCLGVIALEPYNYGGYAKSAYESAMLIFVNNTEDIANVNVPYGQQRIYVMAKNDGVIGCREANQFGKTSTIYCRMEEFDPFPPPPIQADNEEYVKKSDIEEILRKIIAEKENNNAESVLCEDNKSDEPKTKSKSRNDTAS